MQEERQLRIVIFPPKLTLGLINYAPRHESVWGSGDTGAPSTSTIDGVVM
jgi:hypothetical protein